MPGATGAGGGAPGFNAGSIFGSLFLDEGPLQKTIDKVVGKVDGFGRRIIDTFRRIGTNVVNAFGLKNVGAATTAAFSGMGRAAVTAGRAITSSFRAASNTIKSIASSVLSFRGILLGFGVVKLVGRANEAEQLALAFTNLTASIGSTADTMLGKLRVATQGTVSDLELMKAANYAVTLGAAQTEDSFVKMATAATRLGQALGRSAVQSLNDITLGIGRQSRLILDNLGIIVRQEEANVRYAASLGKVASELTDAERRTAFFDAANQALESKLATLGPVTETASVAWARLGATISNTITGISLRLNGKDLPNALEAFVRKIQGPLLHLSEFVAGVVGDLFRFISKQFTDFINGELTGADLFRRLILVIKTAATIAIDAGGGVISEIAGFFRRIVVPLIEGVFDVAIAAIKFGFRRLAPEVVEAARGIGSGLAEAIYEAFGVSPLVGEAASRVIFGSPEAAKETAKKAAESSAQLAKDIEAAFSANVPALEKAALDSGATFAALFERLGEGVATGLESARESVKEQFPEFDAVLGSVAERAKKLATALATGGAVAPIEFGDPTANIDLDKRTANADEISRQAEEYNKILRSLRDALAETNLEIQALSVDELEEEIARLGFAFEVMLRDAALNVDQIGELSRTFNALVGSIRTRQAAEASRVSREAFAQTGADLAEGIFTGIADGFEAGEKIGRSFQKSLASGLRRELDKAFSKAAETLGKALETFVGGFFKNGFPPLLSGAVSAILGGIGIVLSALEQRTESTIEDFENQVQSSEALRGVVVGPTSLPIATIGESLKESLRGVETRLDRILAAIQSGRGVARSTDATPGLRNGALAFTVPTVR